MRPPVRPTLKRPLLTVGVTSYHSASTITRCLQSVVDQSLDASRTEVVVVDDGSTDQTLSLVRGFRRSVPWARFTVLSQRNTGNASTGRNRILDSARGKYVFFLDADDYLGPQALEAMIRSARRHSSEVVIGRYVGVERSAPNVLGAEHFPARQEYHTGWLNSLHVQKLFRADFLRGLGYRFNPQLNYANDHPMMLQAFLHAQRVSLVNSVDCYFLTLAEQPTGQGHVSRAELSPAEQLRFLHDCFGVIALARGQGGRSAELAGRVRADYWNRLLKLHLPVLVLRKSDDAAAAELGAAAANLAEIYGAQTSRARLTGPAKKMLQALGTDSGAQLRQVAAQVRQQASRDAVQL
ncbi:glycosyltransferase family 2 protein [Nesterenkonia sphaerica]|uniref:glycosyltransferase family 2 protein n=1 Tax=Nesterenkonia sphaerica TaxID=1804988 RepID=UPI001409E19A|nr:glycosyltransferase family A protein [Nesterenkonia sphaerica]